ncbi:MAG TPA: folate-binding protein [Marinobacter sp.]|nr:folate-binding protein [Marinobacter sp.]
MIDADIPLPSSGQVTLTNRILMRITGPGTDKFLQGQFSQNLAEVIPGYSPRAAAATPKGRAYCLTRMVRNGDDVLLVLSSELAEATLNHLRKYLMLFRGTSAEIIDSGQVTGLFGVQSAEALAGKALSSLEKPGDTVQLPDGFLIRVEPTAEGLERFEFWQLRGPAPTASADTPLANWLASEISAGVADLTEATTEAFVPQMLNWQHLGGVHFKKGCYTGQEIIARMHFLGQLKRSLFRFRLDQAGQMPAPGANVLAGDRSVGTLVNAVRFTNGTIELLAVVRHDVAGDSLTIDGTPSQPLTQLPLPYSVPEREPAVETDT